MLDPVDNIGDVILRPEAAAEPAWSAPLQPIKFDIGIACFGLLHEPPFIAARIVLIGAAAHVAGFSSVRRIGIAADFNLENLQACAIIWLEKIIEDLGLLHCGIVEEQARGTTTGTHATDSIKSASAACSINSD